MQWHTDVRHGRAVIELMDSMWRPASQHQLLGASTAQGNETAQVVSCATPRTNLRMRTAAHTAAQQTRLLNRPDIQFSTDRCMSGLSCPKVKHLALLKHIARHLVDKLECAWQFPEHKAPTKIVAFTDADWTSNEDDRRSVDTVHQLFGRALLETSRGTQQVTALSSVESEFFGGPHVQYKYANSFLRWTSRRKRDVLTEAPQGHEEWFDGQELDASVHAHTCLCSLVQHDLEEARHCENSFGSVQGNRRAERRGHHWR